MITDGNENKKSTLRYMKRTLSREMELNILALFLTTVQALTKPETHLISRRVLRVAQASHSKYKLSSDTGIPNFGICAKYCRTEECLSFSYTVDEQKCETYSQYIKEQLDADISTATMYFSKVVVSSCRDMPHMYPSGIYPITTPEKNSLFLYCDMDTAGGPWTVIHRRTKGDVDFYREWADYKRGFGTLHGDFWIGNDNLHLLTNTPRKLRVELQAWDGTWGYAEYTNFRVADETENYKLLVNGFSGNVSYNPMDISNGSPFSTKDKDNDESSLHCAVSLKSGWWHKGCTDVNLNGLYLNPTDVMDSGMSVMRWNYFPYPDTKYNSLKQAMMMIR